jgi:hypothetical protein
MTDAKGGKSAYNRSNVGRGGGLDDTSRLLDVHSGEMPYSLGIFGGS